MKPRELQVVPHKGIGPVELGMSRLECRAALAEEPDEFLKLPEDIVPTDHFLSVSLQVHYDEERQVAEFIELAADERARALYEGLAVLEEPAERVVSVLSNRAPFDHSHPELGYSYVFPGLDLVLWRPTLPEDETDPEGRTFTTVGVGRKGYLARK